MAKPTAATAPAVPRSIPRPVVSTRTLEVKRHGNDDYTVTELLLSTTDGRTWSTTGTKVLKPHCQQTVAREYVTAWYRDLAGPNFTGDTGL